MSPRAERSGRSWALDVVMAKFKEMVSTQPAITVEQLARINADSPAQVIADLCNQPAGTSSRRSILTRLAAGEATVNELAEPFLVSLPAISRHLKVLERAGLIVRGREAQWRPSRLQADPLDKAVE